MKAFLARVESDLVRSAPLVQVALAVFPFFKQYLVLCRLREGLVRVQVVCVYLLGETSCFDWLVSVLVEEVSK